MAKSDIDLQHKLEEHLRFETLLTEISANFVNLPADRIDSAITDAQRHICELLRIDRSVLWQTIEEEPGKMLLSHIHQPPESLLPENPFDAAEHFPWIFSRVLRGETVIISNPKDFPPEADRDRESLRRFGGNATVVVPMLVGGKLAGILSFGHMREDAVWQERIVTRLRLVAQIFTNSLVRKNGELELRESEARLKMATGAAGVGLWDMNIDSNQVWLTPEGRELFHFGEDEELNYQNYLKIIHPEDHEKVSRAVQAAIRSDEELRCEYRIVLPDGSIRWIAAIGKRVLRSDGEPFRLMGVAIDISERRQMEEQLRMQLEEIESLKHKFEKENIYLREEIELRYIHEGIVGRSPAMKHILAQAEQVARTDATVLILGETGTGKELLARTVHRLSLRKDRPLITVNCASLPPTLIENELFGREKGAYTGALTRMTGRFEDADKGTLFLDEIGELPIDMQAKLLRVLEQGQFERLGSTLTIRADVRIIAASNRDLSQQVTEGRFRKDLYYRLNVFPIHMPPLREHSEDIPPLVWSFVSLYGKRMGRRVDNIPIRCMETLLRYAWPGNIRELKNVVERALISGSGRTLDVRPPTDSFAEFSECPDLEEVERRHIISVLKQTGGRISGAGGAAEILGLKRTTLQSKMKKLGIRRPP